MRPPFFGVIMRHTLPEIAEAVWLPIVAGLLAAGATWLVWFYSTVHCTPANAAALMCEVTPLGRYLTAAILHDCIIHASIAMTLTGGSDIMLFLRERRRNVALAEQVKVAQERAREKAEEERQRAAEERRLAAEERQRAEQRATEERRLATEERRLAAEERQRAEQRAAEERRLYAEERQRAEQRMEEQHQAMLTLIAKLSDTIDRNGQGLRQS